MSKKLKCEKPIHKQKLISVYGEKVNVDEKLAPLIKELNKAGLVTLFSCQEDSDGLAYVMFDLDFINSVSVRDGRFVISWKLNNPVLTKIYYNYLKGANKR